MKHARNAVSPGYTRGALLKIWEQAQKPGNEAARKEVDALMLAYPAMRSLLRAFSIESKRKVPKVRGGAQKLIVPRLVERKLKLAGGWPGADSANANRWTPIFSGGLPSLGKDR